MEITTSVKSLSFINNLNGWAACDNGAIINNGWRNNVGKAN